jgi:hypothetical protein
VRAAQINAVGDWMMEQGLVYSKFAAFPNETKNYEDFSYSYAEFVSDVHQLG